MLAVKRAEMRQRGRCEDSFNSEQSDTEYDNAHWI